MHLQEGEFLLAYLDDVTLFQSQSAPVFYDLLADRFHTMVGGSNSTKGKFARGTLLESALRGPSWGPMCGAFTK